MRFIDTHAHLNFNAFKDDADKVIARSLAGGVEMINVGSQYSTSKRAIDIAEKYEVYAAVGIHPIHLETGSVRFKTDSEEIEFETKAEDFDYERYEELALSSNRVVAIGEIGLDYYYKPKSRAKQEMFKKKQEEVLIKQMDLATKISLPVIFHCRMAHAELIRILKSFQGLRGVIHCFTGSMKEAEEYAAMGFYLGFNGIIFKCDVDEVIRKIPLTSMLLETDCPYLAPPMAESKRNEPLFVRYVAERVAELKGMGIEEIAEKTFQNAANLFQLDKAGKKS